MLSSVLRSRRAIDVNIAIVRAFLRLRRLLNSHADLARRVEALEAKYDGQFASVFRAIRQLMDPPAAPRRRIGFIGEFPKGAPARRVSHPRPARREVIGPAGRRKLPARCGS